MKSSTTKILAIAVVLLLLVNIAMVVIMVNGKRSHDSKNTRGKGNGVFEMMEKELNMTAEQKAAHQKFRDEYFTAVRPLFDSVNAAKKAFFGLAKDADVSDSMINIGARHIAEKQIAVEKLTFEHIRNVRALYNSDQQMKYDSIIQKMMQRSPPGSKRRDSTSRNN
jgi:hypothetical protein